MGGYQYGGTRTIQAAKDEARRARQRSTLPTPELQPCGTYPAYRRHINNKEIACDPCLEACRTYNREYMREWSKRPREKRELFPCGTHAAFARHRKAGETTDEPCRDARNEYSRDNTARRRERAIGGPGWWACPCGHAWVNHGPDGCTYGTRESNPQPPCPCTNPPPTTEKEK